MVDLEDGLDASVSDLDAIFDSGLDQDSKKFWLNVAHDFLNERLNWSEFSAGQKTRIEAVAAADAASSQDPRVKSERVGDAQWNYQRDPEQTDYWSWALALDHTDTLGESKSTQAADFEAYGPGRGR